MRISTIGRSAVCSIFILLTVFSEFALAANLWEAFLDWVGISYLHVSSSSSSSSSFSSSSSSSSLRGAHDDDDDDDGGNVLNIWHPGDRTGVKTYRISVDRLHPVQIERETKKTVTREHFLSCILGVYTCL